MSNSDLSPAAQQGGRLLPTDKTRVVSTRRRVPTNWVSGRTLQPSIESVVANSFVPSDFLVDGQVSGLGTVRPLLTLSFVSTWILPLHVVSSTLKRESSSSVMDGLQRRRLQNTMLFLHTSLVCTSVASLQVMFLILLQLMPSCFLKANVFNLFCEVLILMSQVSLLLHVKIVKCLHVSRVCQALIKYMIMTSDFLLALCLH